MLEKQVGKNYINMNTDPVADYLTRIRNANQAGLKTVEIPSSKLKHEITKILLDIR